MNKANLSVFASGVGSNLLAIHNASMNLSFPGKLFSIEALWIAKRLLPTPEAKIDKLALFII